MTITAYRITKENKLKAVAPASVMKAWQEEGAHYWVDLAEYTPEDLAEWTKALNLTRLIKKSCQQAGQTTQIVSQKEVVFFEFPVYLEQSARSQTYLSAVCVKNLLLTFHKMPFESLQRTVSFLENEMVLALPTISALVCSLLTQTASRSVAVGQKLRQNIDVLSADMDRNPDQVELESILEQGSIIRNLDATVDEQHSCFGALKILQTESLNLVDELASHFQVAQGYVDYLDRRINRMEKRVAELRTRYDLYQGVKTNQRLGVLTILSAVFLPLTLIAGIYGMNFDNMPELHFAYSYPITLAAMGLIASGMVWFLWRRGWFGS